MSLSQLSLWKDFYLPQDTDSQDVVLLWWWGIYFLLIICLLLGEDVIFLDLLSYYFFICFSVSKIVLLLSPCFVSHPSGGFALECFGGGVSYKFTRRMHNSVYLFNLPSYFSTPQIFPEPRTPFWQNRATLQAPWGIVLHSKALPILIADFIDRHSSE